jgi:hypothetical protein
MPLSTPSTPAEEGRRAAERLDLELRAEERRHRDRVRTRRQPPARDEEQRPAGDPGLPPDLARLRREHAQLAAFHAAVSNSSGWRLLQALRRLVGRAW